MKIDATHFLKFAIKPHGIFAISILVSFLAWVFPGFGVLRKGFEQRDSLVSFGALILFLLYGSMFACAYLSYSLGTRVGPRNRHIANLLSLDRSLPYHLLSAFALFGCAYFFLYLINAVGLSGIIAFISEGRANEIKKALYEDYAIGPLSLRYIVILSGGIAMFRIITAISHSILDFLNLLSLLLTGLASSRLSVIIAGIFCIGLFVSHAKTIRLSVWQPIVAGCAVFGLLAVYNSTRNSNFYTERGNTGVLDAGLSEFVTYLGTPFQGALSTAGHLEEVAAGKSPGDLAGIEAALTTNSALSELTPAVGLLVLPLLILTITIVSFLMGLIFYYRDSYLALPYFVFLYGISEFWRIFMFSKGIFLTLLFFSVAIPCLVVLLPKKVTGGVRSLTKPMLPPHKKNPGKNR